MASEALRQLDFKVTFTVIQKRLIRAALHARDSSSFVSETQRSVIRDLCATLRQEREREKLLIEFKIALVSAATEERIPYGSDRSDLISRLVGVFIEELYQPDGDGARGFESRTADRLDPGYSQPAMGTDSRASRR